MLQITLPFAALLFALVAMPAMTVGQTLCSGPLVPTCIEMDFTYDSDSSVLRCKQDLERYVEEAKEYLQCLDKLKQETRDNMENAQAAFKKRTDAQ